MAGANEVSAEAAKAFFEAILKQSELLGSWSRVGGARGSKPSSRNVLPILKDRRQARGERLRSFVLSLAAFEPKRSFRRLLLGLPIGLSPKTARWKGGIMPPLHE
jgi:hypothetical protein